MYAKTRQEAARRPNEALNDLERGNIAPKDGRQTLGAYLEGWLITKKPTVEPTYWRRLEEQVRIYINPTSARCR